MFHKRKKPVSGVDAKRWPQRRLHVGRVITLLAALLCLACRALPGADQFGYPDAANGDATAAAVDTSALVGAMAEPDPHCGLPGWVTITIDDAGKSRDVCAADFPVWGVAAADPATVAAGADGTFVDARTTLRWLAAPLAGVYTQPSAVAACDALVAAGYSDWRLPTVAELWSTVDFGRGNPAVALPLAVTAGSVAWTAVKNADSAWSVALADGRSALLPAPAQASAWCVRADPWPKPVPAQRFKFYTVTFGSTSDVVVDQLSGLQWQGTASPPPKSPLSSAGWCRNLGLAGHGWRMPTVAEMASVIDRSGYTPAIAPGFFQKPEGVFAALSFSAADPGLFWTVDFATGALEPLSLADGTARARCVRDPCGDGLCASNESSETCPTDCFKRVLIPESTFWQGCNPQTETCPDNAAPAHKVAQSAFLLDKYEVTVAQYEACVHWGTCEELQLDNLDAQTWPLYRNSPINYVTWEQARTFCRAWRGEGYDLPTEAHLELAARGSCAQNGSPTDDNQCLAKMRRYPWGNEPADCVRTQFSTSKAAMTPAMCSSNMECACARQGPMAIGSHPDGVSPFGIHDLAGNVAEWTRDSPASYGAGKRANPTSYTGKPPFVVRGGSFLSTADDLCSSYRVFSDGSAAADIGFRCASYPTVDSGP
jgi:sulfatase modifying factor 1